MPTSYAEEYDLKHLLTLLTSTFSSIEEVYVFGSRRHVTGSQRSDIDLLIQSSGYIKPGDMRSFALTNGPALDLFLVAGSTATSCANESHVAANSFSALISQLNAVLLWSRAHGFHEAGEFQWKFNIPLGVDFEYTVFNSGKPFGWTWGWAQSKGRYFKEIEREGLPTSPYIGGTFEEVGDFMEALIRRLPELSPHPVAKAKGVKIDLYNEYDFQALFYISVKPWLPQLVREEMTVYFDGNRKTADFHLLGQRIIIECKCISDTNSKNEVVKTLEGLKEFYKRNPNVRELLFAILVLGDVELDGALWEAEFSSLHTDVRVRTIVVRHKGS